MLAARPLLFEINNICLAPKLNTKEGRDKLLLQGIDVDDQQISVHDSNPYSTGLEAPDDKSLKITICGVPLSVHDSAVFEMLSILKVSPKTEMFYEKLEILKQKNDKCTKRQPLFVH